MWLKQRYSVNVKNISWKLQISINHNFKNEFVFRLPHCKSNWFESNLRYFIKLTVYISQTASLGTFFLIITFSLFGLLLSLESTCGFAANTALISFSFRTFLFIYMRKSKEKEKYISKIRKLVPLLTWIASASLNAIIASQWHYCRVRLYAPL